MKWQLLLSVLLLSNIGTATTMEDKLSIIAESQSSFCIFDKLCPELVQKVLVRAVTDQNTGWNIYTFAYLNTVNKEINAEVSSISFAKKALNYAAKKINERPHDQLVIALLTYITLSARDLKISQPNNYEYLLGQYSKIRKTLYNIYNNNLLQDLSHCYYHDTSELFSTLPAKQDSIQDIDQSRNEILVTHRCGMHIVLKSKDTCLYLSQVTTNYPPYVDYKLPYCMKKFTQAGVKDMKTSLIGNVVWYAQLQNNKKYLRFVPKLLARGFTTKGLIQTITYNYEDTPETIAMLNGWEGLSRKLNPKELPEILHHIIYANKPLLLKWLLGQKDSQETGGLITPAILNKGFPDDRYGTPLFQLVGLLRNNKEPFTSEPEKINAFEMVRMLKKQGADPALKLDSGKNVWETLNIIQNVPSAHGYNPALAIKIREAVS